MLLPGSKLYSVRGGRAPKRLSARSPASFPRQSDIAAKVCQQALQLRNARNLIIHGLVGFKAHPDLGAAVHIQCAVGGFEEPTGIVVAYTIADLEHFIQGVDACRRAMERLNNFNYMMEKRLANP